MDEEQINTYKCARCGFTSNCVVITSIHMVLAHAGTNLAITRERFGDKCYKCLWQQLEPYEVIINREAKTYRQVARVGGVAVDLPL